MCYKVCFVYFSLLLFDCSGQEKLNIHPSPTAAVTAEASLTFTCTYRNNNGVCPNNTMFLWFLNGQQTLLLVWNNNSCNFGEGNAALNYTCGIAQNMCEITLTLENVHRSQHGDVWECKIFELRKNSSIVVNVPITSVDVTSPTTSPVTVSENLSSTFVCETSEGHPKATITWYKQLGTSPAVLIQGDIISTSHNGTFCITRSTLQLTPIRSDHDYSVFCTASNTNDFSTFTSTNIPQLYVQYAPVIQPIQDRDVVLASPLSVQCTTTADGNPPHTSYRWTRSAGGSWSQTGQTLSISRVEKTDAGNYTCSAWNVMTPTGGTHVNGEVSTTVTLNVLYAPVIQPIQDCDVVLASPLTVQCVTTPGNPPQTSYRWTRSGSSSWSQTGQTLSISRVEKTDVVDYTCTAWNVMTPTGGAQVNGTVSTNFTVNVLCHPRAAELNITVYKALHESVTLNSAVTAYPPPTYTWFKADNGGWAILPSGDKQAHLKIDNLQKDDFTQYKVEVTNGIPPNLVLYYVIEANGKPDAPFNFTVLSDHITHSSALVQWYPGFSGGPPQVFYIEYKKKEDQPWTTIAAVGETAINKTITSLVPNTQYVVRMYANNSIGKSNTTETLEIKTLATEETPTLNLPLIAGLSGPGVAVILIVVLAIVIVVRKRNTPKRKSSKAKKGEDNEVFVPEIVENDQYVPFVPNTYSGGVKGDCTYREVNKFRTAPPANSNVKADGNPEDLYATSNKAKGNANKISEDRDGENNTGVRDRKAVSKAPEREKKTKGGKKKNGDKGKGKATQGDVYENAAMNFLNEDQYANSPAVKETQIYEDVEGSAPQQPQRQANQEGLIYLDLDFQKDPRKATENKIIGIEDNTEYGVIDFNKKANPLPDSDEEDKNAT